MAGSPPASYADANCGAGNYEMSPFAAQWPPDAAAAPAFGLTGAFEADTVALKRYCDFLRQTESIRAQLMESAAQLDAYIQQQIDLARGK